MNEHTLSHVSHFHFNVVDSVLFAMLTLAHTYTPVPGYAVCCVWQCSLVEKGEKVKEIASGTGIANERLRGGKHLIAHTTHSEIWIHTLNRPHRTNNGVLNVCVTWKITKNLKKEAMLFQWFYVEFAISVEISFFYFTFIQQ